MNAICTLVFAVAIVCLAVVGVRNIRRGGQDLTCGQIFAIMAVVAIVLAVIVAVIYTGLGGTVPR